MHSGVGDPEDAVVDVVEEGTFTVVPASTHVAISSAPRLFVLAAAAGASP